jgi:predicted alternative tryptophan synthase beta-subunit
LILYREKDLDEAYKIDCKARSRNNMPWISREDFRKIYEDLMDLYMLQLSPQQLLEAKELPEVLQDSLKGILDKSLHFEPEE